MKILVISNNYPSPSSPTTGVFVYNLVQQFAKLGHEISIISPGGFENRTSDDNDNNYGTERCKVYRPKFVSLGAKDLGLINSYALTEKSQIMAVRRTVRKYNIKFDIVYAHFMTNGLIAYNALKRYGKPVFVAIGESKLETSRAWFKDNYFKKSIQGISGFIAVSRKLRDQLIEYGASADRVVVIPNAVDLSIFNKRNRDEMRAKYNIPTDKKIVMFVGRFLHHKGPLRVLDAIRDRPDIGGIFIGKGPDEPDDSSVVFKGPVPSYMIPELLSASDLFVLPTLREGSSNAIAEAIACGLPIVSSDIPEVRDQCDPSFAVLVDPLDVSAIKTAIHSILDNESLRLKMSSNSLEYSSQLDIKNRAKRILETINTGLNNT